MSISSESQGHHDYVKKYYMRPLHKVIILTRTAGNSSPVVKNYKYSRRFNYQTYYKGMAWSAYKPLKKKSMYKIHHAT